MLKFSLMLLGWCAADLLFWRVAYLAVGRLRRRAIWRGMLGAFIGVQVAYLGYLFVRMLLESMTGNPPLLWSVVAYLWHLVFLPVGMVWICGVVGVRVWHRASARCLTDTDTARKGGGTSGSEVLRADTDTARKGGGTISRREMLGAVAAAVPPLAAMGMTPLAIGRLEDFRVRRYEMRLASLPADLDGVTIAHVTDLHIGRFLPRGMRERVAEATNALGADLIAFTGDVNDISMSETDQAIDFMRRLRPKYGMAMIEGNHDVMTDTERFEGPMLAAGLPLLLDAAMTIRIPGRATAVQFLGINWGVPFLGKDIGRYGKDARRVFRKNEEATTADSVKKVAAMREAGAFPILLAHHPHAFDAAAEAGLPLVLSGHTHGGQIMLNDRVGVGPWRFRYWSGVYRKQQSQLVVANGVGNWFPFRINAPAEIVHLTLKRG